VVVAIAVPITVGDQFYGVVGIDIDLQFLQTMVDGVNLYDGAAVMRIISNNGTLAGVTGKADLRGKSVKEVYPTDGADDMALVARGEETAQVEEGRLEVFLPFTIGTAEKPWSGNILIPQSVIMAEVNALLWEQIGIGALLVLAALIALWFLARGVALPIRKAADLAQAVRRGDLSARLEVRSEDEVGQLSGALNAMADGLADKVKVASAIAQGDLTAEVHLASNQDQFGQSLQEMIQSLDSIVGQINVAADQISSGASEVSDSGQSLSQGATEQASSMEQISASMNQISAQTKLNAENATQANLLANQAKEAAEKGNQRMNSMVGAMSEISQAGQDISKIIKTIDEIAFQTNLLALNAAVEAARAGQHGKGFAVVAEEVRNLAARSAKAARETALLIEGTVSKTNNGTQIANDTAKALEEIVTRISRVTDLVAEIATASNEQAQGFTQVNQGLGEIDKVTQQNTASAEESASAAEELSAQAAELKNMLSRFRLKNSNKRQIAPPKRQPASNPRSTPRAIPAPAPRRSTGGWDDMGQGAEPMIALDDDEFGKY
jgi:methyl-accepting chemotaxis protein